MPYVNVLLGILNGGKLKYEFSLIVYHQKLHFCSVPVTFSGNNIQSVANYFKSVVEIQPKYAFGKVPRCTHFFSFVGRKLSQTPSVDMEFIQKSPLLPKIIIVL